MWVCVTQESNNNSHSKKRFTCCFMRTYVALSIAVDIMNNLCRVSVHL